MTVKGNPLFASSGIKHNIIYLTIILVPFIENGLYKN